MSSAMISTTLGLSVSARNSAPTATGVANGDSAAIAAIAVYEAKALQASILLTFNSVSPTRV